MALALPSLTLGFSGPSLVAPRAAASIKMIDAPIRATSTSEFCYGLPGNILPAGNFDPANLLEGRTKGEVYRFREAEITHGRVGMLASLGFLVQEKFHPLFAADGGPAIEQIPKLPPALWVAMTIGIGACEALRIQKGWANPYEKMENVQMLKDEYTPGDLGFDPLGFKPTDPAELREMQEKELSHGRLAMIAAAGFMAQEAVSGKTWSEQDVSFENFLLGPFFSQAAADIAQDKLATDMIPNLVNVAVP